MKRLGRLRELEIIVRLRDYSKRFMKNKEVRENERFRVWGE